jgi:hypothetical protein
MVRLISRASWDTEGQLFKLTLTLAEILNGLVSRGYSEELRHGLLGKIAKPLPITALAAKRAGIQVRLPLLSNVRREFSADYPGRSLATLIVLLTPNWAVRVAFSVYGALKRRPIPAKVPN